MENIIINEKAKIANTLRIFKEQIALNTNKIKEEISDYEDFDDYEEAVEDDEDDLDYLKDININLTEEFTNFLIKYDIDYTPTINDTPKGPTVNGAPKKSQQQLLLMLQNG